MFRYITLLIRSLLIAFLSACATLGELTTGSKLDSAKDQTGISGQVTDITEVAATGAYVYAYRIIRSSLRCPADFEAQVDKSGH
jgi:hypothetical protein